MTDYQRFCAACLKWQRKFGLTDWRLVFQREPCGGGTTIADVAVDFDARIAVVRWHNNPLRRASVDETAKHEMMHVLLTDALSVAARAGRRDDDDVYREEHKLIERIIGMIQ